MTVANTKINKLGLERNDYKGRPSTLCQGCGHNSISNQIIAACFELGVVPEEIVKFSGIGCSSKSPAYFLDRSFGFNSLHGRMAPLATGAMFADKSLKALGISGDGDTASIGMSGFKHMVRRNTPMLYIVENNGVYGLTKGQFSATAEIGLTLKHHGTNPYMPVDICMEAIISNATFVARSFAGDPKQVKELIKAGLNHEGIAVIDIISPCVTFNNQVNAFHSYTWGKDHEAPLHEISYIPKLDEIMLEDDFLPGAVNEVCMHDGSSIMLKKLEKEYDPTDRWQALHMLEESQKNNWLVTGLIYINCEPDDLIVRHNLSDTPLNRLTEKDLRPSRESLENINKSMLLVE